MKKNTQAGISLIIVLWMLVIMTLLALTFSHSVRTEMMLTTQFKNNAQAEGLAEEGIWRGAVMVLNKAAAKLSGERLRLDGTVYQLDTKQGDLQVRLQASGGLVDLNRASAELIQALLYSIGVLPEQSQTITDSLLDWRDNDDLVHAFGAESADYLRQGHPFGAKNGLINSVMELERINGMTGLLYEQLAPLMTVYSGQPRVDVTSAPKAVLLGLPGMTDLLVENIMKDRNTGLGTVDLSAIPAETQPFIGAERDEFIRISSRAVINGSVSGIIAVIKLEASQRTPVKVMSWRWAIDSRFSNREYSKNDNAFSN